MNLDLEMKAVKSMFKKVEMGTITRVDRLNKIRAKEFKKSAIEDTKWNRLKLAKNKPATVKIQGWHHAPEYFTGELLKAMEISPAVDAEKEGSIDVGYFMISNKKPKAGGTATFTDIAMLQHTGFRIPLTGEKGEKVRGFLASKGIFPKKGKQFLIVKPRPFMFTAARNFDSKGRDAKVINSYIKNLWAKL